MVDFKIKNLTFYYPNTEIPALSNVNLEISQGEFVVLCGKSGSGKSTLLRMLKPELSPKGKKEGEVFLFGNESNNFPKIDSVRNVGFILQNTEYQTVTHTVISELAFGLENLGLDKKNVSLRIAEIATYFSLENIINCKISELSGGQKQLVCLASVIAMHPKAIILDEPTSQLDPVAASQFLDTVKKLCKENGITVIISEHRLENIIPIADRVIAMDNGKITLDCTPKDLNYKLLENNEFLLSSLPLPMKLHSSLKLSGKAPLDISDGRKMMNNLFNDKPLYTVPNRNAREFPEEYAVEMKGVRFAYNESGYVLNGMNIKIQKGSFTALLGANGAGKTTALSLMSGITECKSGKIKLFGKDIKKYKPAELYNGTAAFMPQKCESLFGCNTVKEDLEHVLKYSGFGKEEIKRRIKSVSDFTEISPLLNKHPYDISGGEMQRAALAMILLKEPKILFLDEPTKGMDNLFKKRFAQKITELCEKGATVVMVSHDTEFCAEYCDMCAMIFGGKCAVQKNKYDFFAQNYFYTTSANKLTRGIFENAVTQRQVLDLCKKNLQS